MIGLGFGQAIWVITLHDLTFDLRPSSLHLRTTSSTLSAADDVIDAIGAAKKLRSLLNRAAGLNRSLEVVAIHLGPVGAVV
jgi:hypothetical protein